MIEKHYMNTVSVECLNELPVKWSNLLSYIVLPTCSLLDSHSEHEACHRASGLTAGQVASHALAVYHLVLSKSALFVAHVQASYLE